MAKIPMKDSIGKFLRIVHAYSSSSPFDYLSIVFGEHFCELVQELGDRMMKRLTKDADRW